VPADWGEVAFGFTRSFPAFKKIVPEAKNYIDYGFDPYSPDFASLILGLMQGASKIHFDLSGMRMLNTPDGVLLGPAHLNPLGSTNWELRTIWDEPALRAKTIFYRDGINLSIEEVRQLP
jgi:hypothetical protein